MSDGVDSGECQKPAGATVVEADLSTVSGPSAPRPRPAPSCSFFFFSPSSWNTNLLGYRIASYHIVVGLREG